MHDENLFNKLTTEELYKLINLVEVELNNWSNKINELKLKPNVKESYESYELRFAEKKYNEFNKIFWKLVESDELED